MHRPLSIISTCFIFIVCFSCKSGHQRTDRQAVAEQPSQDQLVDMNRMLIRKDAATIRDYAQRHGWNLTETGTGLFYQIFDTDRNVSASSHPVQSGDTVKLSFSVYLIDGTFCYSSSLQGPKIFIVDKSEAEQGLHQAVKLLLPGDSARFVFPPFLAFGLVGDGNKIPGRAILLYNVRLESVGQSSGQ